MKTSIKVSQTACRCLCDILSRKYADVRCKQTNLSGYRRDITEGKISYFRRVKKT